MFHKGKDGKLYANPQQRDYADKSSKKQGGVATESFDIAEKVERDAFLFFMPHSNSPEEEFAQCETCRMWVPETYSGTKNLCILHGSKVTVEGTASCGLYAIWPKGKPNPAVIKDHADELKQGVPGSVTPEESGLVDRPVRCDNCGFFEADNTCGLYETLNRQLPDVFDLDTKVAEDACCNANTEER